MKRFFVLVGLVLTLLTACQTKNTDGLTVTKTPLTRTESLLHTVVTLSIYHEGLEEVMEEALAEIAELESLLSTNLETSDIYKINQAAGKEAIKVDSRTFSLIEEAIEVSKTSQGRFDISIGAISQLWRIGSTEARKPSDEEITEGLNHIDYRKIELDKTNQTVKIPAGMILELGAISKGFIADQIRNLFVKKGITTAVINLGGNVIVMGSSPNNPDGWKIGVQDPDEIRGATVGSVLQTDSSIVTSGIYERYLEVDGVRYHHILNPKTGYPIDNSISGVTVFTKSSTQADALSTSLFVMGLEEGLAHINQLDDAEAVFVDKDHGVHVSDGLKNTFELSNEEYHLAN
ncbi:MULTISPECIES: FAD:protein FMN transferase [unclassified Streptococcus]|uniref:FAD:protein FMN transferase n=1 Tax=unclassified Streptococcus TaxID=2608887 RepID=UPI00359EB7C2